MKSLRFIYAFFTLFLIILCIACEREKPEPNVLGKVTITIEDPTNIGITFAKISAEFAIEGDFTINEKGICWGTVSEPTINSNHTKEGAGPGAIESNMTGLTPSTTYFARAYYTDKEGKVYYSKEKSFRTLQAQTTPTGLTLTTGNITNITTTSATSGGSISGSGAVTARGVCWSTAQSPTTSNTKSNNGTGTGAYTSSLTSLKENTTYYVRAYAITSSGTIYGNEVSFKTAVNTSTPVNNVTVRTGKVSIVKSSPTVEVITSGSGDILSQGIVWSLNPNPTINNGKTLASRSQWFGTQAVILTTLKECTKYYVRAFVTLKGGTTLYGNEVNFKNGGALFACDPLAGYWQSSDNLVFHGNFSRFEFYTIPMTTSKPSWGDARDKKLIGLGTAYITNISAQANNTWKCSVMWFKGSSTTGVTEVKYSPGTISISSDENTLTINSVSPFTNTAGSRVLTRKK